MAKANFLLAGESLYIFDKVRVTFPCLLLSQGQMDLFSLEWHQWLVRLEGRNPAIKTNYRCQLGMIGQYSLGIVPLGESIHN
jgi:hypothetical protein